MALLAAACGGGSGETDPATSTTARGDDTSTTEGPDPAGDIIEGDSDLEGTDAALADLREANGYALPAQAALDLFAAVFGEVTGADPERFEPRHGDGTLALRAVGAHWEELSDEQRGAILALLGYPQIESFRAPQALGGDAALQARVDAARAQIAAHVGGDVPFPIHVDTDVSGFGDRDLAAAASERDGVFVTSGAIDACRISFRPPVADATVAHEVFHCFQYHLAPSIRHVLTGPDWIIEGSAEWVAAEIAGTDSVITEGFAVWAANNRRSLFSLDYPAVGFFWVIESMGADPWAAIPPMLGATGEGAIAATGLDPAAVLQRIATSIARRSTAPSLDVGAEWDFAARRVPPTGARTALLTVTPDSPYTRSDTRTVFARTTPARFRLTDGDIATVTVISDVGGLQFEGRDEFHTWAGSINKEFCLDEEGECRCGLDDDVESGLDQGAERLLIGAAERDGGEITITIEIRDPGEEFTDGHWVGTFTSPPSTISVGDLVAEGEEITTPFEFTIENGAVVEGSYSMIMFGQAELDDMRMSGVGTVFGSVQGCGPSPQMRASGSEWMMTAHTPDGDVTIPLSLPGETMFPTVWVFDESSDPNRRTGTIDNSGALAYVTGLGIGTTGSVITFEATRTGG
jgi:hypothetical protein